MLNMSFYNGTLNKDVAKDFIANSNKQCIYTYGFAYRNPTTHKVPINKDKALQIIDKESYLDVKEEEKVIHLNAYSSNDMW